MRGYLLIAADEAAVEKDYARKADVSVAVAKSTVQKMRQLGMLEMVEGIGEYVHDWHEHQVEPKPSDAPEAARERQRRSRAARAAKRNGHGDVTRVTRVGCHVSHAPEEEDKNNNPPNPPSGGRGRARKFWEEEMVAWVKAHPITDDLLAAWEPVRAQLQVELNKTEQGRASWSMYCADLHPHLAGDKLVLGAPAQKTGWIEDRFLGLLTESAGCPVQIIACSCDKAACAA